MPKPIHPAAVHFPIAFFLLGYGLDILYHLSTNALLPASIQTHVPASTDLTRASFYLLLLGLITAVPTVITGGGEAVKVVLKQGLYEADGATVRPKIKAIVAHALSADAVIAGTAYIWYARRAAAAEAVPVKLGVSNVALTPAAAFAPEPWHVAVEAGLAALLALAGSIGGSLTYNFGVGFASASAGVKKTQ